MGNNSSSDFFSRVSMDELCTPSKVSQSKGHSSSKRRSSADVLYLTNLAEQRGYARVVHGNGAAAFVPAMHGF